MFVTASAIALVGLSILSYFYLDNRIFGWIVDRSNQRWTQSLPVEGVEQLGKAWVILWLACLWTWRAGLTRAAAAILLGLIFLIPLVPGIKMFVHRDRPKNVVRSDNTDTGQPTSVIMHVSRHSFPSGDTATVFVVAGALLGFTSTWIAPGYVALAGFVGALRIFTLNHYLSDVAAGAAIGLVGGAVAAAIIRRHLSDSFLRRQNRRARWAGGIAVVALIILECAIHRHSSILAFLRIYGLAVVLTILGFEFLRKKSMTFNRRAPLNQEIVPPLAAQQVPSPRETRD